MNQKELIKRTESSEIHRERSMGSLDRFKKIDYRYGYNVSDFWKNRYTAQQAAELMELGIPIVASFGLTDGREIYSFSEFNKLMKEEEKRFGSEGEVSRFVTKLNNQKDVFDLEKEEPLTEFFVDPEWIPVVCGTSFRDLYYWMTDKDSHIFDNETKKEIKADLRSTVPLTRDKFQDIVSKYLDEKGILKVVNHWSESMEKRGITTNRDVLKYILIETKKALDLSEPTDENEEEIEEELEDEMEM